MVAPETNRIIFRHSNRLNARLVNQTVSKKKHEAKE